MAQYLAERGAYGSPRRVRFPESFCNDIASIVNLVVHDIIARYNKVRHEKDIVFFAIQKTGQARLFFLARLNTVSVTANEYDNINIDIFTFYVHSSFKENRETRKIKLMN